MSIEAMKQAAEALEYHQEQTRPIHKTQETITALRQAIEQAEQAEQWDTSDMAHRSGGLSVEQKPVAWVYVNEDGECEQIEYGTDGCDDPDVQPLYTSPPKRKWVGLTDEEIKGILDCGRGGLVDIKKAEQILREKNCG